ncbi:MAG: sodium:solute symporter family protein [Sedimentisphaerales bacterium]
MNLHFFDWCIVACFFVFITAVATYARRYTRSVADFLSASRCAGRYLLTVSGDMAGVGAISIVANFQMFYHAGCTVVWWQAMSGPVAVFIAITGFVLYRFRQTRAMTLAQFFEMRYSKKFRIFAGFLIVISGVLNFGIFPAVGSQFFINICGLSESFSITGISVPTYPVVMAVLLGISLYFTFIGGQISVILTDYVQGFFCAVVMMVVTLVILFTVGWGRIEEVLLRPENIHMINPYRGENIHDFNVWYFAMGIILFLYGTRAWQGSQGFNSCALTPHEAKMGGIIGAVRSVGGNAMGFIIPIGVYTILRHPTFLPLASESNAVLASIANGEVRDQMIVPVVMSKLLSVGLMGCFVATIVAAFIANHQTYLHSWGSIFIQDVIMPFRKKPFSEKQHMYLLRFSMLGVAVFVFIFSLVWRQTEAILLWFQITGAIYVGGAGAVIIGGLYWGKGTTAAAFSSLITGSTLAVGGIVVKLFYPQFFLNGMQISFIASITACLVYMVVSLLNPKEEHNLDKLLHRGEFAIADDVVLGDSVNKAKNQWMTFWYKLGLSDEFSRGDRVMFFMVLGGTFFWFSVFLAGTIYHFMFGTTSIFWMRYWRYYVLFSVALFIIFSIWVYIGGLIDVKKMLNRLKMLKRDEYDDGWVSK